MAWLLEKDVRSPSARFAVVAARFHAEITDALLDGARAAFTAHGVPESAVDFARVPGAFELPLACRALAETGQYSAILALGCVVRGETSHYDFVAGECCRGIMQVGLDTGFPVILGVLTTETLAQARQRASRAVLRGSAALAHESGAANKLNPESNKGWEAAEAGLAMAALLAALPSEDSR